MAYKGPMSLNSLGHEDVKPRIDQNGKMARVGQGPAWAVVINRL